MPEGPRLPRKDAFSKRIRESLEGVAYQIGVLVAIQRNRTGWTQWELAEAIGVDQIQISSVENGQPSGIPDAQIDELFRRVQLDPNSAHASFVKWWRENSTL